MDPREMKLWEIVDEIEKLCEALYASEGELTPEMEEDWEGLRLAFPAKVENVLRFIDNTRAFIDKSRETEKDLAATRKSRERVVEGLENYVIAQMRRLEFKKVETEHWKPTRVLNPPSVRPQDPDNPPAMFVKVEIVRKFQAKEACDYLRELDMIPDDVGETVVEGLVVERKERLKW